MKPWPKGTKRRMALQILWRGLAPFAMPFMLLLARKYDDHNTPEWADPDIQRYKLPDCLSLVETPDEYLPGGTYEPTVKSIYDTWGWFVCSWYWLAWRNVGHGMIWSLGHAVDGKSPAYQDKIKFYGPIAVLTGWKIMRDWHGIYTDKWGFWAVPRFSVRLARNYR
jgi:hypothetical protein